jgi:hypothetical protein
VHSLSDKHRLANQRNFLNSLSEQKKSVTVANQNEIQPGHLPNMKKYALHHLFIQIFFFNVYCLFNDKTIKGVKQYFSINLSPEKHIVLGLLIQHKEPEKSSTISQFTKAYLSCQVLNTLKKYIVYVHMMVPLF